ncbi:MAG: leucine-rich repeat protein [Clostridia bacterium]|nr:leucine-rich repeat protein [Clostridia bacterium]
MKKRYLTLCFLCLILLGSAVATACNAEANDAPIGAFSEVDGSVEAASEDSTPNDVSEPTFIVGSVESGAGESVQVPIQFNNAGKGICGATIRLSLSSGLKLTNIQSGSAFSTLVLTKPGDLATSTPTLLWDGMEEDQSSGEIAVLTFEVPEEAGTYEIIASCKAGDVIDGNLNDVEVAFVSGGITVVSKTNLEPDAILPAALTSIEEEAFAGSSFVYVRLSDKATYIGKRAFADCPNLKHIYIPPRTTAIENDAFEGVSGLVIHGSSGSFAEDYADAHGFAFQSE